MENAAGSQPGLSQITTPRRSPGLSVASRLAGLPGAGTALSPERPAGRSANRETTDDGTHAAHLRGLRTARRTHRRRPRGQHHPTELPPKTDPPPPPLSHAGTNPRPKTGPTTVRLTKRL